LISLADKGGNLAGIYIFGSFLIVGAVVLIIFKIKTELSEKARIRAMTVRTENTRKEEAAKVETPGED